MKVFCYVRVSTSKALKAKTHEIQRKLLIDFCARRNYKIVDWFEDLALTAINSERPSYDEMMSGLELIDAIVCTRLDRFHRTLRILLLDIHRLEAAGVAFITSEQQFDTSTSMGKLQLALLGAFAQFEWEMIKERTQEGIDRARAQGKIFGRPKIEISEEFLQKCLSENASASSIATYYQTITGLRVSVSTVKRRIKELRKIDSNYQEKKEKLVTLSPKKTKEGPQKN